MKKQNTYRLTETADRWITDEAKRQGISKNDVVQMLINRAMQESRPYTLGEYVDTFKG